MDLATTRPPAALAVPGSEVARLIATRDWSRSPLGAMEQWPSALIQALAMILRSPVPMALLWGRDGILLYNDGYARFSGRRHPELLGMKVLDAWPEGRDFNAQAVAMNLCAEAAQHLLGVIARAARLGDGRFTLRLQTGQQNHRRRIGGKLNFLRLAAQQIG